MSTTLPSIINLVNTVFGVSVLAVPYCFHQCGIILAALLLILSSYLTKRSCSLLLRSAQIARKRDFESLGFHVHGFLGKFIVEMSLIGYLAGTGIAWFVVIGDVAPAVLSSLFGIEKSWGLRMLLIVAIGFCAVLPLTLVKDITSLSGANKVAIAIYSLFVLQLFFSALPKILSGDWMDSVNFWRPEGILQCLPIFVISFLCQTVLFVVYETLPEPSVTKMQHAVSTAMDVVLFLSTTVGFCGYVMYADDGIQGDLLNNYEHDFISEFIRLGFCISTILSFPLLVFPCRISINSMMSSAKGSVEGCPAGGTFIPHERFVLITTCLISGTLIFGILFPNVEFVMALVGATMGAMLTYILPSYIFLKIAGEDASKTEAKVILVLGVCLFCLSTFSVLSMSESHQQAETLSHNLQPAHEIRTLPTIMTTNSSLKTTEKVVKLDVHIDNVSKPLKNKDDGVKRSLRVNNKEQITVTEVKKKNVETSDSIKMPPLPQERVLMSQPEVKQIAVPPADNDKENENILDELGKNMNAVDKRENTNDVTLKSSLTKDKNGSLSSISSEKQTNEERSRRQSTIEKTKNNTEVPDEVGKKLDGTTPGGALAGKSLEKFSESQQVQPTRVFNNFLLAKSRLRRRKTPTHSSLQREI